MRLLCVKRRYDVRCGGVVSELRRQLDAFEDLMYQVPACVVNDFMKQSVARAVEEQQALDRVFAAQLKTWNDAKVRVLVPVRSRSA